MIQFHTLGTLDLVDSTDGHHCRSVLAQPKRVGFLAYLAIAFPRGTHQRDSLLGIFWPDSSEKRARNSLNQSVFALRQALGAELFTANGEPGVGLDPDLLWCDVWEFEKALANGEREEALDLYRGNFLEGFYLPGCLDFERWVDSERSRLKDLATGAVLALSQDMEAAGNPVGAVGWLRLARGWAAYDESVLHRQVELLLALGDRSGAVREYESFARRLSVDLGMEPPEEVRDLLNEPAKTPRIWPAAGSDQNPAHVAPLPGSGLASSPSRKGRRFSFPQIAGIAGLGVALGVGAALWAPGLGSAPDPAEVPVADEVGARKRVAVVPLENSTGDARLDLLGREVAEAILQGLAVTGLASVGPLRSGG